MDATRKYRRWLRRALELDVTPPPDGDALAAMMTATLLVLCELYLIGMGRPVDEPTLRTFSTDAETGLAIAAVRAFEAGARLRPDDWRDDDDDDDRTPE